MQLGSTQSELFGSNASILRFNTAKRLWSVERRMIKLNLFSAHLRRRLNVLCFVFVLRSTRRKYKTRTEKTKFDFDFAASHHTPKRQKSNGASFEEAPVL